MRGNFSGDFKMVTGEFLLDNSPVENSSTRYEILLSPHLLEEYDPEWDQELSNGATDTESFIQHPNNNLNIIVVSILLMLGLTTNIIALPVMLFRRTKFGNGQFAVLVLVLTSTDLLTVCCGLVGGLVLEVSHMSWAGNSLGCSSYYFLSSWLLGLANYLVSILIGLVHVKRTTSWVSRLAEVRALLLVLLVASLLPVIPELLVRSTVQLTEDITVCIISANPATYALYVAVKLLLLHILPAAVVMISMLRPQTKVAKRFSSLFLGEGAACECGPGGLEVSLPHHCVKMGDRPDVVPSLREREKTKEMISMLKQSKPATKIHIREDPHRRTYKRLLSIIFLSTTLLYLTLDLSFQIQSVTVSQWEEFEDGANLATALLPATYIKQIVNPLILIYAEFYTD